MYIYIYIYRKITFYARYREIAASLRERFELPAKKKCNASGKQEAGLIPQKDAD